MDKQCTHKCPQLIFQECLKVVRGDLWYGKEYQNNWTFSSPDWSRIYASEEKWGIANSEGQPFVCWARLFLISPGEIGNVSWEDTDEQASSEGWTEPSVDWKEPLMLLEKELSTSVKVKVTIGGSWIYTTLIVPLSMMAVVENKVKRSLPNSASLQCEQKSPELNEVLQLFQGF